MEPQDEKRARRMKAAQSVHFDEHLDNAIVPDQDVKQRERIGTEHVKVSKEALADQEEAIAVGVI